MFYKTFSDYMLDNRYHIAEKLKECKSKQTLIREALDSYDWAVSKAIEHLESYKLLKEEIISEFGEDKFHELENKAADKFMRLNTAVGKYNLDVMRGKKVGYSAEEY